MSAIRARPTTASESRSRASAEAPSCGPTACAGDFYTALDLATSKLDGQLRKVADRRRVHRGRHAPISVAEATAKLPLFERPGTAGSHRPHHGNGRAALLARRAGGDQPWHIVREKEFSGEPMTVDDALYQMELVGHDFYLFHDKEPAARAWSTAARPTTTAC